jgi:hypothetical protein
LIFSENKKIEKKFKVRVNLKKTHEQSHDKGWWSG